MNPYLAKLRARSHEKRHPQEPSKPSKPILPVIATETQPLRGVLRVLKVTRDAVQRDVRIEIAVLNNLSIRAAVPDVIALHQDRSCACVWKHGGCCAGRLR